jgi:hypothetical protein
MKAPADNPSNAPAAVPKRGREMNGSAEHEQPEAPAVRVTVGHAATDPVPHREVEQDQTDDVCPHQVGRSEERSKQPGAGHFGCE